MRWFQLDKLPALAYDHAEIINYALRRLRYKMEYSAAGFELLPDEFTLSELQHTYEIILGEKLDKRNQRCGHYNLCIIFRRYYSFRMDYA